jgi:DNA-binding response OmpR family regulator
MARRVLADRVCTEKETCDLTMRPRIVVVDDDPENCHALSELLSAEGFKPLPFNSGETAWTAMDDGLVHADVVVADVRMPGLNGVALLRRMKTRFPAVPVVLVSAFAEEEVWSEGLRAGAADVFPKPIHGASLVRALRDAVAGGREPGSPVSPNSDPRAAGTAQWRTDE